MKRSRSIRLVLLGGLSAGALAGCGPDPPPPLSADAVYTNNCYVPGVGYYHAPFRAWFSLPYNHFDPQTKRYFYGGQWSPRRGLRRSASCRKKSLSTEYGVKKSFSSGIP